MSHFLITLDSRTSFCPVLRLAETSAGTLRFTSSKLLINSTCQFTAPCQDPEMALLLFQYALRAHFGAVSSEGSHVSVFV